jgi:uncharacterized protein YqjF (DUF2071 family)
MDEVAASEAYRRWAPDRPYDGGQRERDVTFLHYRVGDVASLRDVVPDSLELATFDGSPWITVIALHMAEIHLGRRRLPRFLGSFPEVDLVAHVHCDGRRGLFFLSVESARLWAFLLRRSTGLPYVHSGLRIDTDGGAITVRSGPRWVRGGPAAELDLKVTPRPGRTVAPLAQLLADEFSAFVIDRRGRLCELDEVHDSWSMVDADVEISVNTLADAVGVVVPDRPELVGFSPGCSILTWLPRPVTEHRRRLAPRNMPST